MRDLRLAREEAVSQFLIQVGRLGYDIEKRFSLYKFLVKDSADWRGKTLVALVLPTSFDFYTYRLQKNRKFELLIVQRHNAVVPVNVVDMRTSTKYFPGDHVDDLMREHIRRRTTDEKALLLSQIIAGTSEGEKAVAAMPLRMRQRYLKEAKTYLRGRIGRPFTSKKGSSDVS